MKCKECNNDLIHDNGFLICSKCGLIHDQIFVSDISMLTRIKKQYFYDNKWRFVDGMGSYIMINNNDIIKDTTKKIIKNLKKWRILNKYQNINKIKGKKSTFYRVYKVAYMIIINDLNLNEIILERTIYYHKQILKHKNIKIHNHITLIAYCIYEAVKDFKENAPVSINDIISSFQNRGHRVNKSLILKNALTYKHLIKNKKYNIRLPIHYIPMFMNRLKNNEEIRNRLKQMNVDINKRFLELEKKVIETLNNIDNSLYLGKNPKVFATSVIYYVNIKYFEPKKNKRSIIYPILAKICNVSEFAIRNICNKVIQPYFEGDK